MSEVLSLLHSKLLLSMSLDKFGKYIYRNMSLNKFGKHLHEHSIDEYHENMDSEGKTGIRSEKRDDVKPRREILFFWGNGEIYAETQSLKIVNKGGAPYYQNNYYSGEIVGLQITPNIDIFRNGVKWPLVLRNENGKKRLNNEAFIETGDRFEFRNQTSTSLHHPFYCELIIEETI